MAFSGLGLVLDGTALIRRGVASDVHVRLIDSLLCARSSAFWSLVSVVRSLVIPGLFWWTVTRTVR
jgi:hypothetical protein